jgi:hypothetical protein
VQGVVAAWCVVRLRLLQDVDVMGVIGSGQEESAGDTHNPVIEIAVLQ